MYVPIKQNNNPVFEILIIAYNYEKVRIRENPRSTSSIPAKAFCSISISIILRSR